PLVSQTEKFVKADEDKLPDDVKIKISDANKEVNEALKGSDVSVIRTAMEKLSQESEAMGTALYANSDAAQAAAGAAGAGAAGDGAGASGSANAGDDNVVDAEIVDEDEKK